MRRGVALSRPLTSLMRLSDFCYLTDVVGIDLSDSPAPNSILLTTSSSEERFTFLHHRLHAHSLITQLLAMVRRDCSLASDFKPPNESCDLPAEPLLAKPSSRTSPHSVLPLPLREGCLVCASCYRYDVKSTISTGCPCMLVFQEPIAIHNLLPTPLEWRFSQLGSKEAPEPQVAPQPSISRASQRDWLMCGSVEVSIFVGERALT